MMRAAYLFARDLTPPAPGGYAIVLTGPLVVGAVVNRLLLAYYHGAEARAKADAVRRSALSSMSGFLSVLRQYLGFENRWRVLVPVVLIAPASFIASLVSAAGEGGGTFLKDQSSFFQTAAQVIATLLVTMALTPQVGSNLQMLVVRPVLAFAVIASGIGELAAMSALVSALPLAKSLQPVALSLTISGGSTALLAVVLVGRRLIGSAG